MPVIRITDETWSRLKNWAVPLEDSPEDAIRKVLDVAEEHLKYPTATKAQNRSVKAIQAPPRLKSGKRTPDSAFRKPIIEALRELGGSAPVRDVLKLVRDKMYKTLNEFDYQKTPKTEAIRWENTAMFERKHMVEEGVLKDNSPRGIWEVR